MVGLAGGPGPRISGVGVGGLEPPTSALSGQRSNQLSYTPEVWRLSRPAVQEGQIGSRRCYDRIDLSGSSRP